MTKDEKIKQEIRLRFVNKNSRDFKFSIVFFEKGVAQLSRYYGRDMAKVILDTDDVAELTDIVSLLRVETTKRLLTEP